MPRRLIIGTGLLILASLAQAPAQDAADPALPEPHGAIVHGHPEEADRDITEDLEIFRRILHVAVNELYSPGQPVSHYAGSLATLRGFILSGRADGTQRLREPLAAWIEGTGAVFQLIAPPPAPEPEKAEEPQAAERCPFLSKSPWERTQMELTGEIRAADCMVCHRAVHDRLAPHIETQKRDCMDCHDALRPQARQTGDLDILGLDVHVTRTGLRPVPTREALIEQLVNLLAENGHHFRHLKPDETITIGITFRTGPDAADRAAEAHQSAVEARDRALSAWRDVQASGGWRDVQASGGWRDVQASGGSDEQELAARDKYFAARARAEGALAELARSKGRAESGLSPLQYDGVTQNRGTRNRIDAAVLDKLRSLQDPEKMDDSKFARGVYLEILGGVPDAATVDRFVKNPDPAKREKLIDQLLNAPELEGLRSRQSQHETAPAPPVSEELTGDLALRQGKASEAVEAYEAALRSLARHYGHGDGDWRRSNLINLKWDASASVERLLRKLAQALIAAGRLDEAQKTLDAIRPRTADKSPRSARGADHDASLPSRLTVSAKKSDLDAVTSGQLSREEYRKRVRVSWIEPGSSSHGPKLSEESVEIRR